MSVPRQPLEGTRTRRIHITGRPGSGKTSLARRVAGRTGLPVHHLDDVTREGGGDGRVRDAAERAPMVAAILSEPACITEGDQLGWTDPLLEAADVIVWLDTVSSPGAVDRIVRRFVSDALREMRTRRGRGRFARVRDYAKHSRALAGALVDAARYGDTHAAPTSSIEASLGPQGRKVVRCRTDADIEAFLSDLPPPGPVLAGRA